MNVELYNGMELLSVCLQRFAPTLLLNNEEGTLLDSWGFFDQDLPLTGTRTLFVVRFPRGGRIELPGHANYLVLSDSSREVSSALCKNANAIVVDDKNNEIELAHSLNRFFQGLGRAHDALMQFAVELMSTDRLKSHLLILERGLDAPVALLGPAMELVETSSSRESGDPAWDGLCSGDSSGLTLVQRHWYEGDLDHLAHDATLPIIVSPEGLGRRLVCPIRIGQRRYVLDIPECGRAFDESDVVFSMSCSGMIRYLLARGMEAPTDERASAIFDDVLSGVETNDARILRSVASMGIVFPATVKAVLFSNVRKEASYRDTIEVLETVRSELRSLAFMYGFEVVAVVDGKMRPEQVSAAMESAMGRLASLGFACCISLEHQSVTQLRSAYLQCRACLRSLSSLEAPNGVHAYEDCLRRDFFETGVSDEERKRFCLPIARSIVEFDELNGTPYSSTLYQYLSCFRDSISAAERLHVHRNTLAYRLERAATLFGIDIDDHVGLGNLMLGLEMLRPAHEGVFQR